MLSPSRSQPPAYRPSARVAITGAFWQYSSFFFRSIAQFAVLAVMARLLDATAFGLVGVAMVFVNFSMILSQLGLGPALVQRHHLSDSHIETAFSFSVLMGLGLFLLLFLLAPVIASYFEEPQLVPIVRWIGIVFIIASVSIVAESMLTKQMRFKELLIASLTSYVLGYGACGIVLALLGMGVWALVVANIVQNIIRAGLLLHYYPHHLAVRLRCSVLKELLGFGAGFTLTRVLNYGATEGDRFVIGKLLSVASLGHYSRAYSLMMVVANQVGATLEKVIFPLMSAYQADKRQLRAIFLSVSALVALVVLPISVILVLFAPDIVHLVLGKNWDEVILPFQLLTISLLFRTSYKLGDSVAKATGFVYKRSMREGIYAFTAIVGTIVGCRFGLPGAATAVSGSIILNYFLSTTMGCRIIEINVWDYFRSQWPGIVLGLIASVLALLLKGGLMLVGLTGATLFLTSATSVFLSLAVIIWLRPSIIGEHCRLVVQLVGNALPPHPLVRAIVTRFL